MSISSDIHKSMTNFCALSRDESVFEEKYKQQYQQLKENENKYKNILANFVMEQKKTCIPVVIKSSNPEEDDVQLYLRIKPKVSQKQVTEDNFKQVIEHYPTEEELNQVFQSLDNSQVTFAEVYTEWIIRNLYERNTTTKEVFELTQSKEKKKKEKGKSTKEEKDPNPPPLPREITEITQMLYKTQQNEKKIKQIKKEKLLKIEHDKKTYEETLDKYLSAKPKEKQEQKISMTTTQGETKPFYLRRIVKLSKPSLTLAKSKPIVSECVYSTIKHTFPEIATKPYHHSMAHKKIDLHLLLSDFRQRLQSFKKNNTKISTSIVLEEEGKKKRMREEDQEEEDHNEGDEEGEETQ